jgi:hypothetical protein
VDISSNSVCKAKNGCHVRCFFSGPYLIRLIRFCSNLWSGERFCFIDGVILRKDLLQELGFALKYEVKDQKSSPQISYKTIPSIEVEGT